MIYMIYLVFSVKDPTENPIVTTSTNQPTDEQTTTSTRSETPTTPDTGKTQAWAKLGQSQSPSTGAACYCVFESAWPGVRIESDQRGSNW